MMTSKSEIPGFFCSDPDVQEFCERQLQDFNPYRHDHYSGLTLADEVVARFGPDAAYDLGYWMH